MRYLIYISSFLVVFLTLDLSAQSEKKMVREGNGEYEDGNFSEAEVQYRKALTKNPNYYNGKFNLGDAMYEQENFEESAKLFDELAEANLAPEQKAKVHYNQGNNLMQAQKYDEAIDAYKKSLRLNPDDYDAKYNLEYARKKLSDQQQQQDQENQDQDKDQDKEDQKDQEQDKNKDDQEQDKKDQEQDKNDQQKDQNQDNKDQEQDQQQQQQQNISKQDAQRMLDALKNDEKKTLQKLQKEKAKATKGGKTEIDW